MDSVRRTPTMIVTGFLGSGKTTLLNHLLTDGGLGRVAALVNDFGAINIDAELVNSVADEVVSLVNGCICCSINGDLLKAAERVLAIEPPIDRIIVETTGLADPLPVGLTFLQTELRARTSLEAVITVVDCANFALDLFKSDAAMAQIIHADVIVLNKIDLVDDAAVRSLARRIQVIKPRVRLVNAMRGQIPKSAVMDNFPIGEISGPGPAEKLNQSHLHNDGFSAHAFRFARPLSARRFQEWLDRKVPDGVFRAKGIVRFETSEAYVFHLCGSRASFEPYPLHANESRLVFIGRDVDEKVLERDLEACTATASDATAPRQRVLG